VKAILARFSATIAGVAGPDSAVFFAMSSSFLDGMRG
jgi:hypothetical protein